MGCKLTQNITKSSCQYAVSGVRSIYLFNYDPENEYTFGTAEQKGVITAISLANSAKAFRIDFSKDTASWTDDLALNGNGGKYRTHTLNFTLSEYNYTILNEGDALSLGEFTAVVVDRSGRAVILGRTSGLSATSFNYASGSADADANGWTTIMAGTEMEIGRLLESESIISSLVDKIIVTP